MADTRIALEQVLPAVALRRPVQALAPLQGGVAGVGPIKSLAQEVVTNVPTASVYRSCSGRHSSPVSLLAPESTGCPLYHLQI
jgi:hypothetical protein